MESLRPDQAAKLFMRPQRKAEAQGGAPFENAQRVDVEFEGSKLALWRAGQGPLVFLLHGWEGTAADMQPFVAPLLAAGYSVAALDMPAHGASEGKLTSLVHCARALNQVLDQLGSVHAVVSHSVGCPVAVEAMKAGHKPKAAVLIGTPARYKDYAYQFAMQAGLDKDGTRQMLEELRGLGVDVASINTPEAVKSLDVPALLIHSDDDRVIPQAVGKEVADAWPGATFLPVTGLGHRKILAVPQVVDAVVTFVAKAG